MKRKGKFTIANLIGTFILVFLLYVLLPVINIGLNSAWNGANFLTKAALALILPGLLFGILGYALVSSQPRFEEDTRQARRRLRR